MNKMTTLDLRWCIPLPEPLLLGAADIAAAKLSAFAAIAVSGVNESEGD